MKYIALNIFLTLLLILFVVGYLFKARPLIVTSNSMSPSVNKGDLVVVFKSERYEMGDIISFENKGKIVTHRIVSKINSKFKTKGDVNWSSDLGSISNKNILGKVRITVPFLGFFFMFLQSKYFFYLVLLSLAILLFGKIKDVKN